MSRRNTESIDTWTAHWQFNSKMDQTRRPELDLLLEPIWYEFTDILPDGARILDLATGNGPVAFSCAERAYKRKRLLHIHAVDAARIEPPGQVPDPKGLLPIVRFQGGVWLEDLPFEDGEFNGVTSQYGFEYADEEQAISEASRVLAPGGLLRLLIHARDGAVWQDIDFRHKRLTRVLAEDGVLNLILELVRAQKKQDISKFNDKLSHLPAAVKKAQQLAHQAPSDDSALFYSREFLFVWSQRKQYRLDDLLRSLEDGWVQASGTAERYAQMLRVARTAEDIGRLCSRAISAGLTISAVRQACNPNNGAQIAWQLDARKPC